MDGSVFTPHVDMHFLVWAKWSWPRKHLFFAEEASKVSSWRGKVMKNILSVADDHVTPNRVADAMVMRDEYAANQYHKIWLMGDQFAVLLKICGLALPLFLPLVLFFSRHPDGTLAPWGYRMVTAVLVFDLLGPSFSTAQSLINSTHDE